MPTSKPSKNLGLFKDVSIDKNIVARAQVIATNLHGESDWTSPLRVDVQLEDGVHKAVFVKVASGDIGKSMLHGEFESMSVSHSLSPDFVVKPLAWGACASAPDTYFYMSEFHELGQETPDPEAFCSKIAELHTRSAQTSRRDVSSGKKYGFQITTHLGMFPQDNRWCSTWEEFYIKGMKRVLAFEERTQGPSKELDELAIQLLERVIPRLLRPLETNGLSIEPTLVHGDLQIRNARTDLITGMPKIFDAGAFWGHNECDLGKWRIARFRMGLEYMIEYHKYVNKSAPEEDWEDRNILYSIRFNLLSSAHYPSNGDMRTMALKDMRYLVEKYPEGYRGDE